MNTVLFDLDGTLLPFDTEVFEEEYFKRLLNKLSDLFPSDDLKRYIWDSTIEMVKNMDENMTNKDVFLKKFSEFTDLNINEIYDRFMDFYHTDYMTLGEIFIRSEYMINAVKTLNEKGYTLVVATNPLFPLDALKERIKWAGLDAEDFSLITSFENMHFCKPQIKYYEEILKKINKTQMDCLMVGNDVEEDLIAKKIGIKTYLLEDYIINKKNIEYLTDYRGTSREFYQFTANLPYVKKNSHF